MLLKNNSFCRLISILFTCSFINIVQVNSIRNYISRNSQEGLPRQYTNRRHGVEKLSNHSHGIILQSLGKNYETNNSGYLKDESKRYLLPFPESYQNIRGNIIRTIPKTGSLFKSVPVRRSLNHFLLQMQGKRILKRNLKLRLHQGIPQATNSNKVLNSQSHVKANSNLHSMPESRDRLAASKDSRYPERDSKSENAPVPQKSLLPIYERNNNPHSVLSKQGRLLKFNSVYATQRSGNAESKKTNLSYFFYTSMVPQHHVSALVTPSNAFRKSSLDATNLTRHKVKRIDSAPNKLPLSGAFYKKYPHPSNTLQEIGDKLPDQDRLFRYISGLHRTDTRRNAGQYQMKKKFKFPRQFLQHENLFRQKQTPDIAQNLYYKSNFAGKREVDRRQPRFSNKQGNERIFRLLTKNIILEWDRGSQNMKKSPSPRQPDTLGMEKSQGLKRNSQVMVEDSPEKYIFKLTNKENRRINPSSRDVLKDAQEFPRSQKYKELPHEFRLHSEIPSKSTAYPGHIPKKRYSLLNILSPDINGLHAGQELNSLQMQTEQTEASNEKHESYSIGNKRDDSESGKIHESGWMIKTINSNNISIVERSNSTILDKNDIHPKSYNDFIQVQLFGEFVKEAILRRLKKDSKSRDVQPKVSNHKQQQNTTQEVLYAITGLIGFTLFMIVIACFAFVISRKFKHNRKLTKLKKKKSVAIRGEAPIKRTVDSDSSPRQGIRQKGSVYRVKSLSSADVNGTKRKRTASGKSSKAKTASETTIHRANKPHHISDTESSEYEAPCSYERLDEIRKPTNQKTLPGKCVKSDRNAPNTSFSKNETHDTDIDNDALFEENTESETSYRTNEECDQSNTKAIADSRTSTYAPREYSKVIVDHKTSSLKDANAEEYKQSSMKTMADSRTNTYDPDELSQDISDQKMDSVKGENDEECGQSNTKSMVDSHTTTYAPDELSIDIVDHKMKSVKDENSEEYEQSNTIAMANSHTSTYDPDELSKDILKQKINSVKELNDAECEQRMEETFYGTYQIPEPVEKCTNLKALIFPWNRILCNFKTGAGLVQITNSTTQDKSCEKICFQRNMHSDIHYKIGSESKSTFRSDERGDSNELHKHLNYHELNWQSSLKPQIYSDIQDHEKSESQCTKRRTTGNPWDSILANVKTRADH